MLIAATILKVLGVIGIIGSIVNIAKKKKPEENKRTLKGSIVFLAIGVILGFMAPDSNQTASTQSVKSEQQIIADRQSEFQDWMHELKEPTTKLTELTPFFDRITKGLADKQLTRAEAQVAMEQLSNYLDDISDEFRSLKLPNEKSFTKEQYDSLKFVKTNLQDASNNYSIAADKLADFIETKNDNRLIDVTNYMDNANAHTNNATEKLKELTKELGIKLEKENDITLNLN